MDEVLTIGQLAQRAGIGVSTIRFYEQKGLIEGPPRNKSGYRLYPPKMVEKVRFIKNCRDLGFSLRTVADLLKLCYIEANAIDCASVQARIRKQHQAITEQYEVLNRQREKLEQLLTACPQEGGDQACDFIQVLLD
ncbi:MerR family transcriptional regulator [Sedimenticola selenatireducens]|uniref:MerR family transcriptional regulator n=1 Tax=Sedimenticola selenatireducens TaxID=191960 RepID=A0A558DTT7_9GAMM|nr:MerR family transcriptional regulator [Sedimenticola selenatireducens]TVO76956.1 MerR family transcriptional regulator [Sedimenticola selenatireducens]TVT64399.1 MAG: MerR family transcriptional regulator [Sedimenticola selenatireducens]